MGVFFLLAQRLGGRAVAVPATGLLAINSFLVRHEQLARSYAISMLLVVLGALLFVRPSRSSVGPGSGGSRSLGLNTGLTSPLREQALL